MRRHGEPSPSTVAEAGEGRCCMGCEYLSLRLAVLVVSVTRISSPYYSWNLLNRLVIDLMFCIYRLWLYLFMQSNPQIVCHLDPCLEVVPNPSLYSDVFLIYNIIYINNK